MKEISNGNSRSVSRSVSRHDCEYEILNPASITPGLIAQLRHHAFLVWILLPIFAVIQAVVPGLEPSCSDGYSNYSFGFVVLILAHHLYAEKCVWAAAKSLCTQPELCVLRQLGVLRRRRRLVLLGLMQDLDLYSNLMFPLVARSCDFMIAAQYLRSWEVVPVMGPVLVVVVRNLRFWGSAAILMGVTILLGAGGLCYHVLRHGRIPDQMGQPRLLGGDFVLLAQHAELALTPSVTALCEAMSEQRRHVFLDNDAGEEVQARRKLLLGRLRKEDFQKMELANHDEREEVQAREVVHLSIHLAFKVLIGVVLQLWLQASFFELSYDVAGAEAKYKVVAGMLIAIVLVLVTALRFCDVASKLGCIGVALFTVCALVIAWSIAKVYFGVKCSDHLWNLSTGCVDLSS